MFDYLVMLLNKGLTPIVHFSNGEHKLIAKIDNIKDDIVMASDLKNGKIIFYKKDIVFISCS